MGSKSYQGTSFAPNHVSDDVMTLDEAGAYLKIDRNSLYALIVKKILHGTKDPESQLYIIPKQEVKDLKWRLDPEHYEDIDDVEN